MSARKSVSTLLLASVLTGPVAYADNGAPGEAPSGFSGGMPGGSSADIDYSGAVEIISADSQSGQTYASTTSDESALLISTSEDVTIEDATVTKFVTLFVTLRLFAGANEPLQTQKNGTVRVEKRELSERKNSGYNLYFDTILHENADVVMTKMTNLGVEKCGSSSLTLKSSQNEQKSLKSIGFEAFQWQREKDSK